MLVNEDIQKSTIHADTPEFLIFSGNISAMMDIGIV